MVMETGYGKQQRLLGIELLRILMVYCVILHHINPEYSFLTIQVSKIDVYVFAAIAFFFIDSTLTDLDKKYVHRIKRLIIPLWSWSVFYYVVYGLRGGYGIRHLLFQMLTGVSGYNPTLWFLANQIYLISIFCVLKKTIKRNSAYWIIMSILSIICILIQSQCAQCIYDDFYLRNTIGRILAIFPVVMVGKIAKVVWIRLKQYENLVVYSILLLLEIIAFVVMFIFTEINEMEKLGISFLLLMIFNSKLWKLLDNHKIFNNGIINISRYTLGVYCLHVIVLSSFQRMQIDFKSPYILAVVVYVICVMVCIAISRVVKLRALVQ